MLPYQEQFTEKKGCYVCLILTTHQQLRLIQGAKHGSLMVREFELSKS